MCFRTESPATPDGYVGMTSSDTKNAAVTEDSKVLMSSKNIDDLATEVGILIASENLGKQLADYTDELSKLRMYLGLSNLDTGGFDLLIGESDFNKYLTQTLIEFSSSLSHLSLGEQIKKLDMGLRSANPKYELKWQHIKNTFSTHIADSIFPNTRQNERRLEAQLKKVKQQQNAQEIELRKLKVQNDTYQTKLKLIENENSKYKSQLAEQKIKLQSSETELQNLRDSAVLTTSENISLSEKLRKAKQDEEIASTADGLLQSKLISMTDEKEQLKQKIALLENKSKASEVKLAEIKKQFQQGSEELKQYKSNVTTLQNRMKDLTTKKNSEIQQIKDKLNNLEIELKSKSDECVKLIQENKELKSKVKPVIHSSDTALISNSKKSLEHSRATGITPLRPSDPSSLECTPKAASTLKSDENTLNSSVQALTEKIKDQEDTIKQLTTTNNELQEQIKANQQKSDASSISLTKELADENERLAGENKRLAGETKLLKAQSVEALAKEIQSKTNEEEAMKKELELELSLKELALVSKKQTEENTKLEFELTRVKELYAKETEASSIRLREKEELLQELETLKSRDQQPQSLSSNLEAFATANSELSTTIDNLRAEIKSCEAMILHIGRCRVMDPDVSKCIEVDSQNQHVDRIHQYVSDLNQDEHMKEDKEMYVKLTTEVNSQLHSQVTWNSNAVTPSDELYDFLINAKNNLLTKHQLAEALFRTFEHKDYSKAIRYYLACITNEWTLNIDYKRLNA